MHSFSIASILGQDTPAQEKKAQDETIPISHVHTLGSNLIPQDPLLTSTPLPKDMAQDVQTAKDNRISSDSQASQEYPIFSEKRDDSVTPVIKDGHNTRENLVVSPPIESLARVEKWVLQNCVRDDVSSHTNRRDIVAESFDLAMGETASTTEQSETAEDKSASSGSHDHSFTSESCSRPGSPDIDRRPSKKARTSFSASQLCDLETKYRTQRYISGADRIKLARKLRLSNQQVNKALKFAFLLK